MNWKSKLRAADVARQAEAPPALPADLQRIRTTVILAARDSAPQQLFTWPRPFVLTSAALSVICAATLVVLQQSVAELRQAPPVVISGSHSQPQDEAGPVVQKQQLHFSTPGGTRIIWVFDADFDVKGTLP